MTAIIACASLCPVSATQMSFNVKDLFRTEWANIFTRGQSDCLARKILLLQNVKQLPIGLFALTGCIYNQKT
jgi:hypothetical protein